MPLVKFYPGDGTEPLIDVAFIGEFPKDVGGLCAFCHGDPLAEYPETPADAPIRAFYARNPDAETCPMCNGRPS